MLSLPACEANNGSPSDADNPITDAPRETTDKNPMGSMPEDETDMTYGQDGSIQPVPKVPVVPDDPGQAGMLTSQMLHSDGQRVVLHSTDSSDPTYIVLTYAGTDVTGLYTYIEHGSTEEAHLAVSAIVPNEGEGIHAVSAEGPCLVIEHTPEAYRRLTLANLSEAYPGMIWI